MLSGGKFSFSERIFPIIESSFESKWRITDHDPSL
jgi:hypothetical protein